MARYYGTKECVLFLEAKVPNDLCESSFTYHYSASSSAIWKYLYSTRKMDVMVSVQETNATGSGNG